MATLMYTVLMIALGLCGTAAAGQVGIVIEDPANDPDDVGGYRLYYWQQDWDEPMEIDMGYVHTYLVQDLENGQTYFLAVTAYDTQGARESMYSNVVSVRISRAGRRRDVTPVAEQGQPVWPQ